MVIFVDDGDDGGGDDDAVGSFGVPFLPCLVTNYF